MKKRDAVLKLSKKIFGWIKPYCKRIEIVGSIRRKATNPRDIDIVLIPKNHSAKEKLEKLLEGKGKRIFLTLCVTL